MNNTERTINILAREETVCCTNDNRNEDRVSTVPCKERQYASIRFVLFSVHALQSLSPETLVNRKFWLKATKATLRNQGETTGCDR